MEKPIDTAGTGHPARDLLEVERRTGGSGVHFHVP
jgi:hypothetical protein